MKYTVLRAQTIEELEKKVNESIKDGWYPQGGIQFAAMDYIVSERVRNVRSYACEYMQAMINVNLMKVE